MGRGPWKKSGNAPAGTAGKYRGDCSDAAPEAGAQVSNGRQGKGKDQPFEGGMEKQQIAVELYPGGDCFTAMIW